MYFQLIFDTPLTCDDGYNKIKESSIKGTFDDLIDKNKLPLSERLMFVETNEFGSKGNHGIVAIYSKDPETEILLAEEKFKNEKRPEIMRIIHPGFHQAKEFYNPKYTTQKPEADIPDYRSTFYWNPVLKFDKEGHAKISFYGSDSPTTFSVELEGLTSDGIPFVNQTFIDLGKPK